MPCSRPLPQQHDEILLICLGLVACMYFPHRVDPDSPLQRPFRLLLSRFPVMRHLIAMPTSISHQYLNSTWLSTLLPRWP